MLVTNHSYRYNCDGALRFDFESNFDGEKDWAMVVPPESGDVWVVVIHGHGSTADQLFTREDKRKIWLPYFQEHGLGILCPNVRNNSWMNPAAASDLHELIEEMRARYSASRFFFASSSMGGTSNLIYSILYPGDVSGILSLGAATDLASYMQLCRQTSVPILLEIANAIESAYGDDPGQYEKHSTLHHADRLTAPTIVVHGGADEIIPVSQTRALAAAMGDRSSFAYIEIPGGNHDSPIPKIDYLEWILNRS